MGCIYMIQNLVNGKSYVGQTTKASVKGRRYNGLVAMRRKDNRPMTRAIQKYGMKSFVFVDLMTDVPKDSLDYWERFFITSCGTMVPGGYNVESGGNKKKSLHPETRRKISEAQKGRKMPQHMRDALQPYWDSLKGVYKPWSEARKKSYTMQKHPLYKKRVWIHPEHGTFEGGIAELVNAFPEQKLCKGALCANAKGYPSMLQHKGWKIKPDDLIAANN